MQNNAIAAVEGGLDISGVSNLLTLAANTVAMVTKIKEGHGVSIPLQLHDFSHQLDVAIEDLKDAASK